MQERARHTAGETFKDRRSLKMMEGQGGLSDDLHFKSTTAKVD